MERNGYGKGEEFAEIEDITDRQTGKDYDVVQIQSKEITQIIKNWIKG